MKDILYIPPGQGETKISLQHHRTIVISFGSYSKECAGSEKLNAMEITARQNFGLCTVVLPKLRQSIHFMLDNGHL